MTEEASGPLGFVTSVPASDPIPDGWIEAMGQQINAGDHDLPVPPGEDPNIFLPTPDPGWLIANPDKKMIIRVRDSR